MLQFYGINEGTDPVFFGDASSGKFGTYFVKDGKVGPSKTPFERARSCSHLLAILLGSPANFLA